MARFYEITPNKTYATLENAKKAADKKFGSFDNLTYFVQRTDDGRFFPVFVGERALQAMVHFHFNVVA